MDTRWLPSRTWVAAAGGGYACFVRYRIGSSGGEVFIHDARTGEQVFNGTARQPRAVAATVLPDGSPLAVMAGADRIAEVWQLGDPPTRRVSVPTVHAPTALCFPTPDELVVGTVGGLFSVTLKPAG